MKTLEPKDTPYITGISALNIPAPPDNRQPDWHALGMWEKRRFTQHGRDIQGPVDVLGNQGLWDASDIFAKYGITRKDKQPIYCAIPERAIIDLAYSLIKKGKPIFFRLTDFIEEEFHADILQHYIKQIRPVLTQEAFCEIEKKIVL